MHRYALLAMLGLCAACGSSDSTGEKSAGEKACDDFAAKLTARAI